MLLKKLIPLFTLFLLNTSYLQAGSFLNGADLHSEEIVIQYSGEKGYLHIVEYNIRSLKKSKADIEAQAAEMIQEAKKKQFCKKRFKLEDFTSLEETFQVKDRKLDAEYHLMTHNDNVYDLLKSIMSEILGEEVTVEVTPKLTVLQYNSEAYKAATGSNAIGPVEKDGHYNLFWRPGTQNFQMIFNTKRKGKPIRKYFPEKVGSRKLSKEEIESWRDQ